MCNNYRLTTDLERLIEIFSDTKVPLKFPGGLPNIEPRQDIRITDRAPVVRAGEGGAELVTLPWSWKGPAGKPVFNFRGEGRRFAVGRCLIPADGFYEFTGEKSPKTKWLFTVADAPLFAIAGYVKDEAFTMLTCEPGEDIRPYHDRQVVILRPDQWLGWLSHAENERDLIRPLAAGSLKVERMSAPAARPLL